MVLYIEAIRNHHESITNINNKPKVISICFFWGTLGFNANPIVPLGRKFIADEIPNQCTTWRKHGAEGCYIRPSLEHFRCYKNIVTETRSEHIADIVYFQQNVKIPTVLSADAAMLAAWALIESLQKPATNAPLATINDIHHETLRSMAWLFNIITTAAEQQSTNRHNGCRRGTQEVSVGPNQISAPLTHGFKTRKHQH